MKRRTLTILVISFIALAIIWFLLSGRIIGNNYYNNDYREVHHGNQEQ
ncbi:hypothetical protein [Vallitalea sp.]|nr:hypothetical protein [Vallitalea sp.]MCT4686635.1 hypothetical protein [Vallitalea sp.]